MTRRPRLAAALLGVAVLLGACAGPRAAPTPTASPAGTAPATATALATAADATAARAVLAARASSPDAVARYQEMEQRLRAALDAAVGPLPWTPLEDGTTDDCYAPFTDLDAQRVVLPTWYVERSISDKDWSRTEQVVTDTIRGYGFTAPTRRIDAPGHHETTAEDPDLDAHFDFGSEEFTSMTITTGCHRNH